MTDTAIEEEEESVVVATLDPDGDGLVTVSWGLDEGFYGGQLWIWSWDGVPDWTEIGSEDVGAFAGDITSDPVEIASGSFQILQGWYFDASGILHWIAGNIGDANGDGVWFIGVTRNPYHLFVVGIASPRKLADARRELG